MNCDCKGHPFNCYDHPNDCGCNADEQYRNMKRTVDGSKVESTTQQKPKPDSVGKTGRQIMLETMPHVIKPLLDGSGSDSVLAKEIWNAAIEAAYLIADDMLTEVAEEIRKLKK